MNLDEKYFLSSKAVHAILKKKGVINLYHANTVSTSLTFIQQKALLSRGYVESNQLNQTSQKSDNEDKKFNVWNDVFLDGFDLHKKYTRPNLYGPILFAMKLDLLLSPSLQKILITKNNPMYWKDEEPWHDRYYSDLAEISNDYLSGKKLDSRIMFTFRDTTEIKLKKFLDYLLIDTPQFKIETKQGTRIIGEALVERVRRELNNHELKHVEIKHRHQGEKSHCSCSWRYPVMYKFNNSKFKSLFYDN